MAHSHRRNIIAVVLAVGAFANALPAAAQAQNPLAGKQPFLDCEAWREQSAASYQPWYWFHRYKDSSPSKAALLGKIAKVPGTKWFAGDSIRPLPTKMLERFLARVDDPQWGGPECDTPLERGARDAYVGDYPVMAIRAMKHDRCRGYDGGGAWNRVSGGAYKPWIDEFVKGLKRTWYGPERYRYFHNTRWPDSKFRPIDRQGVMIIEPDALPLMGRNSNCLSRRARANRYALLSYAAKRFGEIPGLQTYIDAGASDWLRVGEAVSMLRRAGVRHVRGFALNSTHFEFTKAERRFGDAVAKRLGKRYVINTAENANGPLPRRFWTAGVKSKVCNPRNAGLGTQPTSKTGSRYADALLWISRPGLSSNGKNGRQECGRGPLGNVWWEPHALSLARQANFRTPFWPPRSL